MDHIVYLDTKSNELEKLIDSEKSMIIRGWTGRKMPYWRVNIWDELYFIKNNAEWKIRAKATVKSVFNSEKMEKEDSIKLVEENQKQLLLSDKQYKRWAGKRYIVLIEVSNTEEINPFPIDKSNFSNMDDWLLVEDIESVKVS